MAEVCEYILPRTIDENACTHKDEKWLTFPRSDDLEDGWQDLTFGDLGRCTNNAAHWIEENVGASSERETIAYMGENDANYVFFLAAAMKAGYKVLLPSTRNSLEGQLNLLEQTQCNKFLYSEAVKSQVELYKQHKPTLALYEVPSVQALVAMPERPFYPGRYSTNIHDISMIMHTSGSTGLPKPIPQSNGWINSLAYCGRPPNPEGRVLTAKRFMGGGSKLFTMSPFFHALGMAVLFRSLFYQKHLVLLHSRRPPSADLIIKAMEQTQPDCGVISPSLLEELIDTPGGEAALSRLDFVIFAGAPLAQAAGERIKKLTELVSTIGATEHGLTQTLLPVDPDDWCYFEWSELENVDMRDSGDGLCELVIRRHPQHGKYQGYFHTFPEATEWRTKDLFRPHPSRSGLWKYMGRKDDLIVLSNGEKVNPVAMEKLIEGHPLVKGALVVGQGRFQTGLLLEPDWTRPEAQDVERFIELVWPTVEEANAAAMAHGRVWKSKVAVAKREKPFVRAPKGSVVRRQTVNAYAAEIDALYQQHDEGVAGEDELGLLTRDASVETIKAFLRKAFALTLPTLPKPARDADNIFDYGADSLQVLAFSSVLTHALPKVGMSEGTVPTRIIYAHPTIESLAEVLHQQISPSQRNAVMKEEPSREVAIQEMIKKYTHDLPTSPKPLPAAPASHTVILTGSTGSLGNYILEHLIHDPKVTTIHCLNRSTSAESRQRESFLSRGTNPDFTKVRFHATDFSQDRFGLSEAVYAELLRTTTAVIHNAWAVDFNLGLPEYERTHIAGTRRVVDFALAAAHTTPHILFVSSIASVGNWRNSATRRELQQQQQQQKKGKEEEEEEDFVPERTFDDPTLPLPQGYGESKHIASMILHRAAERAGVPVTVLRTGQLAGPSTRGGRGVWNRHEWLPSLVATSKAMGLVPDALGQADQVDWLPTDLAAKAVVEVLHARTAAGAMGATGEGKGLRSDLVSLVNPKATRWAALVPAVKAFYARPENGGVRMETVSMGRWVEELKRVPLTKEEIARKPGVKLLDFYEALTGTSGVGLPRLRTERLREGSETMREIEAVDGELMARWCEAWGF